MKFSLSIGLLALTLAVPVSAADESREKQMLRRMQQQMQQIDQARTQAEQDKATALADKDALAQEVAGLKSRAAQLSGERAARSRAERELKMLQAERDALQEKLAATEASLLESQTLQRTTADTLARTEAARKQTDLQLADTRHEMQQCRTHNVALYGLSREMMTKYRDKSCQDALVQAEPFTGLKNVEVENLLETWRDRADQDRLSRAADPAAVSVP